MISPEQYNKINILDKLLNSSTEAELQSLAGPASLANMLKGGGDFQPGVLGNLILDAKVAESDIIALRNNISVLTADVALLLRAIVDMQRPAPPLYSTSLDQLKNKYKM